MGWTILRTGVTYRRLQDAHDAGIIGDTIDGDDDQTFKVRSRDRLQLMAVTVHNH